MLPGAETRADFCYAFLPNGGDEQLLRLNGENIRDRPAICRRNIQVLPNIPPHGAPQLMASHSAASTRAHVRRSS
jgi:hypothetical protein